MVLRLYKDVDCYVWRVRTSRILLKRTISDSTLEVFSRYSNGNLSLNHPDQYAQMLLALVT